MAGTTEWEDALIKHGVIEAPKPKETEDDRYQKMLDTKDVVRQHELESKTLKELDDLEDDIEDEELEALRRRRIEQMMQTAAMTRFGALKTIGQTEFVDEVSTASRGSPVVCHLFSRGLEECTILDQLLGQVAVKFKHVKFVRILGSEAIKNYPESACPTLLIYNKGDMVSQIVGLKQFGGKSKINADIVEWVLARHKILETTLEENPLEKLFSMDFQGSKGVTRLFGLQTTDRSKGGSDDDEW
eukprot:TRINITY_DN78792_c0_g1_i1.p1 TRINITY_DN78792_c0_g1~~TRINITY_DN78792_c0_g1_i1.p1  ORF type:complete len:244 (+),score=73.43 TRINITY_DN78792_c0_g1_i1:201-932(+)